MRNPNRALRAFAQIVLVLGLAFVFVAADDARAQDRIVCGRDIQLRREIVPLPAGGLRPAEVRHGKAGATIVLNAGAGLSANAEALAAWQRAAQIWEGFLNDVVTVTIDADLAPLGPGILGSTGSRAFQADFAIIRDPMVADAAADESILNQIPTLGQLSVQLPPGFTFPNQMATTKANLRALGFDMSFDDPFADATITFSTGFASDFDYDPSDGIDAGKFDFEAIVIHEMGHALGFTSEVDDADWLRANSATGNLRPSCLDMLRLLPATGSANFTAAARLLSTGDLEPTQVIYDGNADIGMSTGAFLGDGRQASHFKADELTGVHIGIMDPTLGRGDRQELTASDIRVFGLIGWDVNAGVAGPALTALAADQVTSGNDSDGTTAVTLDWPQVGLDATVEVFRKPFGGYPAFDDNGGAAPSLPATPGDALSQGWTSLGAFAPGATDEPTSRDFYYYIAFVTDSFGVSTVSNRPGSLNYHLGDVSDGTTPGSGDNTVGTPDLSVLGARYNSTLSGPSDPFAYLDVGPTLDLGPRSLPTTDMVINFEDLIITAINFGQISKGFLAGPPAQATNSLELRLPAMTVGQPFAVDLYMSGDATIQGMSVFLQWDNAVCSFIGLDLGPLWLAQPDPKLLLQPQPAGVDLVLLGSPRPGISGDGILFTFNFQMDNAGDPAFDWQQVTARDAQNSPVEVDLSIVTATPATELTTRPTSSLLSGYPNPFNPSTQLRYRTAQAGAVHVAVYTMNGRLVRTLVDEDRPAGDHEVYWNGQDDAGSRVASGSYLVMMRAVDGSDAAKVTLLK